jgi:phospho-N-acetylmuramoyl-pentapeptide-transferase
MLGVATGISSLTAFLITWVLGFIIIPFLLKLKTGQTILDIGPKWHKSKQGTPTMGGIMMIIGVTIAVIIAVIIFNIIYPGILSGETDILKVRLWGGLLLALSCGLIGFIDDYLKVVKKQNAGLLPKQKLLLQFAVGVAYALGLYFAGDTKMYIPFLGNIDFGILYIPLIVFFVVGFTNAVNLTDGLDGLASSVTFFAAIALMVCAGVLNILGITILGGAVAGACLGFLIWNFYPAKVFMGDTGSLFLGGAFCALAFGTGMPILLFPMGIMYIIEASSVILQVLYFKLTHGKRLFKMSPIHHHFEMKGASEMKIVILFSLITAICSGIAIFLVCKSAV